MHTTACFKIVNKCKVSKFARFKSKDFSRIFKYFQAPYLFSSTFKGLKFLFQIQAFSRISQARYKPCKKKTDREIGQLLYWGFPTREKLPLMELHGFRFIMFHVIQDASFGSILKRRMTYDIL